MKQRITEEQLRELSDKGREKLVKWFEAKSWFPHFSGTQMMLETFDKTLSDCIGIGQMIEFLDDNAEKLNDYGNAVEGTPQIMFHYFKEIEGIETEQVVFLGWENELCDDLWEAVKQVLET